METESTVKSNEDIVLALQVAEETFGNNHLSTAMAIRELALFLCSKYQNDPAPPELEPLCRRRVEIVEKLFGDKSIEYSDAAFLHAQALEHSDRVIEAVPVLYLSWQLSKKLLGNDHDRTWPKHLTFMCYLDEIEKNNKSCSLVLPNKSKQNSKQKII
jgi:hypothetical protein